MSSGPAAHGSHPLRIFTAPGESPDLLELLPAEVIVEEVAAFDQVDVPDQAAVVYLSRGLLKGLDAEEWSHLPDHVAVVASDSQARGEAEKAGRLFLSMEDFTGDEGSLRRVLRAAQRYSASLLAQRRGRPTAWTAKEASPNAESGAGPGRPLLEPDALDDSIPAIPPPGGSARYRGAGHEISLALLAPEDALLLQESYAILDGIYQAWRVNPDDPPWLEVAERCRPLLDPAFQARAHRLGDATRGRVNDDSRLRAVIHDLRGGGLSAALMEAEILREAILARDSDAAASLANMVYLARDQAKMMRNAVPGLDPAQRAEDESERPHDLGPLVRRWSNARHWARGRAATVAASMDRGGQLASCCLEMSAVDRVLYNHINNATAFATDGRVALQVRHPSPAVARFTIANRVAEAQSSWLQEQWREDPHALYRARVTRGGQGLGLANAAFFVVQAFGLARPQEALEGGYLGARLVGDVYAAWFHWPAYPPDPWDPPSG